MFQVAAKALETAVFGAYYNVTINLKDIADNAFKTAVSSSTCSLISVMNHDVKNSSQYKLSVQLVEPELGAIGLPVLVLETIGTMRKPRAVLEGLN